MNVQSENGQEPPFGDHVNPERDRSLGILHEHELSQCRDADIPVAFDPVQSGWVPLSVNDDISHGSRRPQRATDAKSLADLKLSLRPWHADDAGRFRHLLDDPRIWDHMPEDYPDPLTHDMAEALIHIANNSNHHKVLAILHDGTPVGQVRVEFDHGGAAPDTAEISYWIGRQDWGRGYASAVVSAFAAQCLTENPALTSLVARVKDGNAGSLRVLEKAGFVPDGPDSRQGWIRLRRRRT